MNTVLDLIGEFGLLNDAKGIWGEKFPPESERRWRELKDFYDLLMSKSGIGPRPVTRRFKPKEVEEKVTARERLRVPLENEMIWVRLFWNGGFGMSHSGKGSSHLTRLRWRPLTGTTLPSA